MSRPARAPAPPRPASLRGRSPRPTPWLALGLLVVGALGLGGPRAALGREGEPADPKAPAEAQPGDRIQWVGSLRQAFERAGELGRPVMICINARFVLGRNAEEPAAKGLREVVYLDPRVVTRSRLFVCVFLTPDGNSEDYGELRARFGIDGEIVSPQHIFALPGHPDGAAPAVRREYWPYGKGEEAVKELLALMDQALEAHEAARGAPPPAPEAPAPEAAPAPAPPGAEERAEWIRTLVALARDGTPAERQEALAALLRNDQEGDCSGPVVALLGEDGLKKRPDVLIDVVRALGRPGLLAAAGPIAELLKHKDDLLRANAVVSLEYIGSPDSVRDLTARLKPEKVVAIQNHLYRALGRCGAGDAKVRALLLKEAKGADSEEASFGPIVGLAYFERDEKAARGVEKLLKQMGPPSGGRRGGWGRGTLRRALLAWTLAEIGDPKGAAFMREELIPQLEHTQAWWTAAVVAYYEAIARTCEGDEGAKGDVDQGIRRTLGFAGGTERFRDAARRDRDVSRFEPKAEWEVEAVGGGGMGGGGEDAGGGGGGGR